MVDAQTEGAGAGQRKKKETAEQGARIERATSERGTTVALLHTGTNKQKEEDTRAAL
jgi:N-acetylglucosamine-6-phosphate deacetylase